MNIKWSKEQLSVIEEKEKNMLVAASAGSGKTAVMIEKVMALLCGGADVRRILMMTFSRAAAQEMRDKLIKKIYENLYGADGAKLKKQLEYLPFAQIGTIDGFCYSLMRKYFNAAGCDPSAAVGDEKELAVKLNECFDRVMEKYLTDGDEEFLRVADYLRKGRSYNNFRDTVIRIRNFSLSTEDPEAFLDRCVDCGEGLVEAAYLRHKKLFIPYILDDIRELVAGCDGCNYINNRAAYLEAAGRLESAEKAATVKEFAAAVRGLSFPPRIGQKALKKELIDEDTELLSKRVGDRIRKYAKDTGEELDLASENGEAEIREKTMKAKLVEVCRALDAEYSAYKKRRGVVDFNDTERCALRALVNPVVAEEVRNAYDYVFIDEYQDINYLQEKIISAFSQGNVFAVGDVKQAIYHFRNSEPQIFIDRSEKYAADNSGKNFSLNTNYRSCEAILDFTNRVCAKIMTKDFCGIDYKNTSKLNSSGLVKGTGDAVEVFLLPKKEKEKIAPKGIYRVRTAPLSDGDDPEALFTAAKIKSLVGSFEFIKDTTEYTAAYSDVAVLVRRRSDITPVSKAFEKFGVPYYIAFDSKTVLPERETLVDSLRCALNAEQDIPLYNVMSSAIGDFTRAELLEIRRGAFTAERKKSLWESLYTYKGNPKIEEKAKRFIAYLEDMRVKSSYMKASELMKMSLGTGFDAYLLSLKEDKINAVNAFIEYVGTLPQDVSCADFLEFYDNAYEGNGSPKKADAVAVMTMHASKGLEFPIVFLPYSDCCPKSGGGETLIDGELGLAVSLYADEDKTVRDTFAKTAMRLKRTDDERREQARLMYVAFTRARYKLVITGKDTAAPYCVFEGASNMQWIKFAAERDPAVGARVFTAEPPAVPPPNEARNIGEKSFDRSFAARRYAYENATKLPVKYSVSELLEKYDGFGYNPFTAKTASEAVNAGIALHEVMQRIDYGADTLAEVKDAISGMVKSGFLEQTEADAVDAGKVLALLKTDVMRRAAKSKTMREQPFIMNVRPDADAPEKALVQGVIDLVIDCGDSCEIVDFKTGSGSDETMKARYSEQLALYAEGVEKILKKPVSAKIILCAADARAIYL